MSDQVVSSVALNPYDIGVFIVLFLSVVFGIIRGFTREVLSIGGWAGALIGTIYGYPMLRDTFRDWIGNVFLGDVATVILLFVSFLVFFTLIIRTISDGVKGSKLGGLDRALGLLFGFFRGGLLVVGAFFASLIIWKTPEARPPAFQTAKTLPYVIRGAESVVILLPQGFVPQKMIDSFGKTVEKTADDLMKSLARPKPKGQEPAKESSDESDGYKETSRQEMGRLFKNFSATNPSIIQGKNVTFSCLFRQKELL